MYNVDQPSLYQFPLGTGRRMTLRKHGLVKEHAVMLAHLDARAVPPYTTWIDVARHNKWYGRD